MVQEVKDKLYFAEKTSDTSRMTMAYFHSVDEAKAWAGNASSFRVMNKITEEVILERDPQVFDNIGSKHTAVQLEEDKGNMLALKRNFY